MCNMFEKSEVERCRTYLARSPTDILKTLEKMMIKRILLITKMHWRLLYAGTVLSAFLC